MREVLESGGRYLLFLDPEGLTLERAEREASGREEKGEFRPAAAAAQVRRRLDAREPILQFFETAHLPAPLREVSAPFGTLARAMADRLPLNGQRDIALQRILDAKDAAVRALLHKGPGQ